MVMPEKGTVAFGSGLHGWGFNVERFAKIYAAKMGADKEKMMKRLWGDSYFNAKKKTWTNVAQPEGSDKPLARAFCQFIMTPINQLMRAIMDDQKEKYEKMMTTLGITLKGDEKQLIGKPLMKRAMQIWINAADTLLSMIVMKLPSPRAAQKYRVENLYEGPMDDEGAAAIRSCDPAGPVMMYVSKMVPTSDKGRFYAFGRVFSGTIATGQKVRIQGPHYKVGGKEDLNIKNIQRTVLMMGRATEQIADVPCGNTVALVGIDAYILKSGTITTLDTAHNIADMKYSVSPVVKVAVKPKDGKDLPKLVEGLKKLSKSDPLVVCTTEESGEHIIAGCGELHIEICLKDLVEEYAKCEIKKGAPSVQYRETVTAESSQTCLSKSPNKHNRLFVKAEPLSEEVNRAIEANRIYPTQDLKTRTKLLEKEFGWDKTDALKIWGFGPAPEEAGAPAGANLLVDQTKGIQYLNEIKESMNSGLLWAAKEGPICEENMRSIRFNLLDVKLHTDSIHRGMGQIQPTTRRVLYASTMLAEPRIVEPVFMADIEGPATAAPGCLQAISACRGELVQTETVGNRVQTQAFIPIAETIGATPFATVLSQKTNGSAFVSYKFDHWEPMSGNPMSVEPKTGKATNKSTEIALSIRERKGLKVAPPVLFDYLDKL